MSDTVTPDDHTGEDGASIKAWAQRVDPLRRPLIEAVVELDRATRHEIMLDIMNVVTYMREDAIKICKLVAKQSGSQRDTDTALDCAARILSMPVAKIDNRKPPQSLTLRCSKHDEHHPRCTACLLSEIFHKLNIPWKVSWI